MPEILFMLFYSAGEDNSTRNYISTAVPIQQDRDFVFLNLENVRSSSRKVLKLPHFEHLTLADVRKVLTKHDYMTSTDNFYNIIDNDMSRYQIAHQDETDFQVKDIMKSVKGQPGYQVKLEIGNEPLTKDQDLADKFLYGLVSDSSGRVTFSQNQREKIASIPDKFEPTVISINQLNIDSSSSSSIEEYQATTSNAISIAASVSVSFLPLGSSSAESSNSENKSSSSHQRVETAYIVSRVSSVRKRIILDGSELVGSKWVLDSIKRIVDNPEFSDRERAVRFVKFLKDYGWFIPVDYHVGGILMKAGTRSDVSLSEALTVAVENSLSLKAELSEDSISVSAGASSLHGFCRESQKSSKHSSQTDSLMSVGAGGASNLEDFQEQIVDQNNWVVLSISRVMPTFALILKSNAILYGQISTLLFNMAKDRVVSSICPSVDLRAYAIEMSQAIHVDDDWD